MPTLNLWFSAYPYSKDKKIIDKIIRTNTYKTKLQIIILKLFNTN